MTEEQLADIIATGIKTATQPIRERLEAVEAQTKALEARGVSGGVEYAGTFEQGKTYRRGNLVTTKGSLWLVLTDTTLAPSANPSAWRLVVKKGDA